MPRKIVAYEPYINRDRPGEPTEWGWDCNICYQNQTDIADEHIARRLANDHARTHGTTASRG